MTLMLLLLGTHHLGLHSWGWLASHIKSYSSPL